MAFEPWIQPRYGPGCKPGLNRSKTWVWILDSNPLNPGVGCNPSSDPHTTRRTPHTTTKPHAANDRNKKHNFHTQQGKKQNDIASRDLTSDLIKFQSNQTPYFSTYKGFERTKMLIFQTSKKIIIKCTHFFDIFQQRNERSKNIFNAS